MVSYQNLDLSMKKLFPTDNQMIDPRIRYANEPGFTHGQRPFQSVNERIEEAKKLGLFGFEIRPLLIREARFICIGFRIYHLFTFIRKYIFPCKF